MSTIVFRDGIMAADSRAFSGDKHPIGEKLKIRRLQDGTLIGVSTTIPGAGEDLIGWYERGCPEDFERPENFQILVVKPNGDVMFGNGQGYLSGPLRADFFSIGSGEQYAWGALKMGASAVEAVRVACAGDPWTKPPIYAITHALPGRVRLPS